jgi:hypothetical protein
MATSSNPVKIGNFKSLEDMAAALQALADDHAYLAHGAPGEPVHFEWDGDAGAWFAVDGEPEASS